MRGGPRPDRRRPGAGTENRSDGSGFSGRSHGPELQTLLRQARDVTVQLVMHIRRNLDESEMNASGNIPKRRRTGSFADPLVELREIQEIVDLMMAVPENETKGTDDDTEGETVKPQSSLNEAYRRLCNDVGDEGAGQEQQSK